MLASVVCRWWNNRMWVYWCAGCILNWQSINISNICLEIHIVYCVVICVWPNSEGGFSYILKINILSSILTYDISNHILNTCASIKATLIFEQIVVCRDKVPFILCLIKPVVIRNMILISTNDHTFVILYASNRNIGLRVEVFFADHFYSTVKVITFLQSVSNELGDLVVPRELHQHVLSQTFCLIISWKPSIHSN